MAEHVLVAGLSDPRTAKDVEYVWQNASCLERRSSLAILKLLKQSGAILPDRVVALVTERAGNAWSEFEAEVEALCGAPPRRVDIPDGRSLEELQLIMRRTADTLPAGVEVTFDITQGFRIYPFLSYALALYLQSLRGIKVRQVLYSLVEENHGQIIDVGPLLTMPEWFYAVRVFRDYGATRDIANLLEDAYRRRVSHQKYLDPAPASELKDLASDLEAFSFAYESGLPLELGKAASSVVLRTSSQTFVPNLESEVVLAAELLSQIQGVAKWYALEEQAFRKKGDGNWKPQVVLNDRELARQARLIAEYLDRGQIALALGLMREWIVSWWLANHGDAANWLDRAKRQQAERSLFALSGYQRLSKGRDAALLSDQQTQWGKFWDQLREARNGLHHHGMRPATVTEEVKVDSFWREVSAGQHPWTEIAGGSGTLLITPLGTQKGVLFSALCATKPDRCLIVCSDESVSNVPEAIKAAGWEGEHVELVMHDPHAGFDEIQGIQHDALRHLVRADRVLVNLTGGTTCMGIAVQELGLMSRRLARSTSSFALIDRRPRKEQEAEPWVVAELYWLKEDHDDAEGC